MDYRDIVIEEQGTGEKFNIYQSQIETFNKFNLGALLGAGVSIKELFYFEIEYHPNFTKNLDEKSLRVKDNCWVAKLGININELMR